MMIDPGSLSVLDGEIQEAIRNDQPVLDALRAEVRPLLTKTRRIQPRSTTAISLVGTDAGQNQIEFDPFMIQLVRVVDSSNNEHCLEVVTPTSDIREVNSRHLTDSKEATSSLGKMMTSLGVSDLWSLSPMIPKPVEGADASRPVKPSWVQVYRELMEWATLFSLVTKSEFGSDTVIVMDGNLRSKVFKGELFLRYRGALQKAIERHWNDRRRRIFVAGIAKHSKVLQRYRLAMALEGVLRNNYPSYVEVPREMEERAYVWQEYARGDERAELGGEANKFVAGKMFLVKFGSRPHDPIWPVDILISQTDEASTILSYLLADALDGFPVPFYPSCLQKAHENAALVDFDYAILQDRIYKTLRETLGQERERLDELTLQEQDPSARRYRG
jgi:hypothetical protein